MQSSSQFLGIPNLGNTCYIAASLQCLYHIPRISSYFLTNSHKTPEKTDISSLFSSLCKQLLSEELAETLTFEAFLKYFDGFCDGSQEDAQEFLKLLLEKLHNICNKGDPAHKIKDFKYFSNKDDYKQQKAYWLACREKDNSIIIETFCGQMASVLKCPSCKAINKRYEDFWDISLSFKDTSAKFDKFNKKDGYLLTHLLEEYLKSEYIHNRFCEKCFSSSGKTEKKLEITRFPDILILHLKRFYFKGERREKLHYFVKYPLKNLKLLKNQNFGKASYETYELRAVIHHLGDLEHGHYYAECKESSGDVWFQFNDQSVEDVFRTEEECLKKGSDTAYIFFYEKKK